MQAISLSAHFDGQQILLDEPYELPPNTRLIVTVVSSVAPDQERMAWYQLAAQGLAGAYGDDEPEYTDADIKSFNPTYDGR